MTEFLLICWHAVGIGVLFTAMCYNAGAKNFRAQHPVAYVIAGGLASGVFAPAFVAGVILEHYERKRIVAACGTWSGAEADKAVMASGTIAASKGGSDDERTRPG